LTANPLKIKPAINQVELSYWNPQPELVAVSIFERYLPSSLIVFFHQWAKNNGILLEAYSPLGSQDKVKDTLSIPEVKKIAGELGITPAQAHISWQLQRGVRICSLCS
jgi:diketogulonate reductase-like aldo/keto reductase